MSELTSPILLDLPNAAVAQDRTFPISGRTLKLTAALAITTLGAYGVLSESRYISTSNAVVSAYVLDVRTPIEGVVSGLPSSSGDIVTKGQLLGRVDDPLTDRQHLDNLRLAEEAAHSEASALTRERDSLLSQRSALLDRTDLHLRAMTSRLADEILDSAHTLSARQVALSQADSELRRGRALHEAGIMATAEFERLQFSQASLSESVSAQRSAVAALRGQYAAMAHGVLSEPGTNNDVAYSRQRADEISIRLAELSRSLASATAQAQLAHNAVEMEESRNALLTASELRAPTSGLLWKLNAMNGEHTVSGAPVLSLVDCNRQFLLAEISQDRLANVIVRGQARIRLSGEAVERTGTVLAAAGDPQREMDRKLAAAPVGDPTQQLATVLIGIDHDPARPPSDTGCLVGRAARVRIPSSGTSLLSQWFSERI